MAIIINNCLQEKLYLENISESVAVLRKLSGEWKVYSGKLSPLDHLKETLNHLRAKVT